MVCYDFNGRPKEKTLEDIAFKYKLKPSKSSVPDVLLFEGFPLVDFPQNKVGLEYHPKDAHGSASLVVYNFKEIRLVHNDSKELCKLIVDIYDATNSTEISNLTGTIYNLSEIRKLAE